MSWAQAAWIIKRVSEQIPTLTELNGTLSSVNSAISTLSSAIDFDDLNQVIGTLSSAISDFDSNAVISGVSSSVKEYIDTVVGYPITPGSTTTVYDRLNAIETKLDALIADFGNVTLLAVNGSGDSEGGGGQG